MKFFLKKNKKFFIYSSVGIVISIVNIISLWIFIDIFRIPTLISSSIIVGALFFLKFYLYLKTGLVE